MPKKKTAEVSVDLKEVLKKHLTNQDEGTSDVVDGVVVLNIARIPTEELTALKAELEPLGIPIYEIFAHTAEYKPESAPQTDENTEETA